MQSPQKLHPTTPNKCNFFKNHNSLRHSSQDELSDHKQQGVDKDSEYLTSFFSKELYNSCESTDELIKKIEKSENECLGRQALALYQNRYGRLDEPWNHVTFMYGFGLIYMHYNAYNWAVRAFRQTLYMQPNFPRARDIHTRLGLIFKSNGRYKLSEKHFKLAIKDTRPSSGTCSNLELQFHLAHLLELQRKYKEAQTRYERLLQEKNVPANLSANIQHQLGCIYSNDFQDSPTKTGNSKNPSDNQKINAALNYLNSSNQAVKDTKTSYHIGRCFTNIGRYQDAFASYRNVIDKEESTADTWCSIGVLYHRQNQPTDALQAYIQAVQFDKNHEVAWTNLGLLYENHKQYHDAIKCFRHALTSSPKKINNPISDRINFIRDQIVEIESSLQQNNSKSNLEKLISLEDLWNMESKINSQNMIKSQIDNNINLDQTTHPSKLNLIDVIKTNSVKREEVLMKTNLNSVSSHQHRIHLSAKEVIDCRDTNPIQHARRIDINLLSDELRPPQYFPKPPPYPPLPPNRLFPSTPSVFLESKKDIVSKKLQEYCQSNPISILRNLATVLKLDLGLFSTKTLLETNPDQEIYITSHSCLKLNNEERLTDAMSNWVNNSWACDASRVKYSIGRYASYQVASFKESIHEEVENKQGSSKGQNSMIKHDNDTESNEFPTQIAKRFNNNFVADNNSNTNNHHAGNSIQSSNMVDSLNNSDSSIAINNMRGGDQKTSPSSNGSPSKRAKRDLLSETTKRVLSAEDIDISDEKLWRSQLHELNKLPSFIKCVSASNLLTHMGSSVKGINTPSMSMHVPGCRIFRHIRPNNLCSININVGPGEYEWCAVSAEYGSVIAKLCNKNGLELEDDNWWPCLNDLQKHNIPIYRFSQRPGDLVWINSGTITWVQATGWCNNISWNIGPLCDTQYRQAAERFELNKMIYCKSVVPMIQLTWNIIMNINIILDDEFHDHIVGVLARSLQYCAQVKSSINNGHCFNGDDKQDNGNRQLLNDIKHDESLKRDKEKTQSDSDDEPDEDDELILPRPKVGKYCSLCECEVFNIHLIHNEDKLIYCFECARRIEPNMIEKYFKIVEDYELRFLMKLYDDFIDMRKRFDATRNQNNKQQTNTTTTKSSQKELNKSSSTSTSIS